MMKDTFTPSVVTEEDVSDFLDSASVLTGLVATLANDVSSDGYFLKWIDGKKHVCLPFVCNSALSEQM